MTKPLLCATSIAGALLLLSIPASADEPNVCKDSYEHAQEQMKSNQAESQLLLARESLRTCIRAGCKDWMVSDCSKWLGEVDSRIPTVVFSAKTSDGRDLVSTRVTKPDGSLIVETLDGRALEIEPGAHDFVFTTEDGKRIPKRALVREGEKSQRIEVVVEVPREGPPVPPPTTGPLTPASEPPSPALRYTGFGIAGLGVVGIGLGTVFGLTAISKKNEANCNRSKACDPPAFDDANKAADIATASFIVGGALLAGGVVLVLLAPKGTRIETHAGLGRISIGARW